MVDLETPGYPSIELGHPMDIHYSPVTCLKYVPDPSTDLIPGLYQVTNRRPSRNGSSKKVDVVRSCEVLIIHFFAKQNFLPLDKTAVETGF